VVEVAVEVVAEDIRRDLKEAEAAVRELVERRLGRAAVAAQPGRRAVDPPVVIS